MAGAGVGFLIKYSIRVMAFAPSVFRRLLCSDTRQDEINGDVSSGFEEVKKAFVNNFAKNRELSAQCVVYVGGEKVVDIFGTSAASDEQGYNGDSVQIVWSSSKAVTAMVVAKLVEDGHLDYKKPICTYWKEFAEHGKEKILLEDLMRHEAGLDVFSRPVSREDIDDFMKGGDRMAKLIEGTTPVWSEESRRCYHGVTRGMVINELVKKVTGQTVGQHLKSMCSDAGVGRSLNLGVPEEEQDSLPLFHLVKPPVLHQVRSVLPALLGTDKVLKKQLGYFKKGSFAESRWMSKSVGVKPANKKVDGEMCEKAKWYVAFESPSTNMHANARGLAGFFNHFIQKGRGLSDDTFSKALEVTTPEMIDVGLGLTTTFSNGGWCQSPSNYFESTIELGEGDRRGWYGWMGFGGSMVFFNRALNAVFAYTMTGMELSLIGDVRTQALIKALESCLVSNCQGQTNTPPAAEASSAAAVEEQ